jgi:hypothetical protein
VAPAGVGHAVGGKERGGDLPLQLWTKEREGDADALLGGQRLAGVVEGGDVFQRSASPVTRLASRVQASPSWGETTMSRV